MKPTIGITASAVNNTKLSLSFADYEAVLSSNGIPLILPNLTKETDIEIISQKIDGLMLSGGGDIDPTLFGEEPHRRLGDIIPERDYFEISLVRKMLEQNKPILGICRGCQIMNIAVGGDMFQDIYSQNDRELLQHTQKAPASHKSHFVNVNKDSNLSKIVNKEEIKVNSFHHQAVRKMGCDFEVVATSNDGIIEAIESKNHPFVLGVQWHPELMVAKGDQPSIAIFNAFIAACRGQ